MRRPMNHTKRQSKSKSNRPNHHVHKKHIKQQRYCCSKQCRQAKHQQRVKRDKQHQRKLKQRL
jgi:hypothetical protein